MSTKKTYLKLKETPHSCRQTHLRPGIHTYCECILQREEVYIGRRQSTYSSKNVNYGCCPGSLDVIRITTCAKSFLKQYLLEHGKEGMHNRSLKSKGMRKFPYSKLRLMAVRTKWVFIHSLSCCNQIRQMAPEFVTCRKADMSSCDMGMSDTSLKKSATEFYLVRK